MRININNEKKYVDIWLDHDDPHVDVKDYIAQYPNYSIAILRSGYQDLAELTSELLRINK